MYKYILAIITLLSLSACSHFSINGMMCDQIRADQFATIPPECRNYSEAEANKASKLDESLVGPDDLLIFKK